MKIQMKKILRKMLTGYQAFREKYVSGDHSVMRYLSTHGQRPEIMIVACCDSRVDPALILQCDPGDLFVLRNVANIVPPFEDDDARHGTSAALEFGIRFLKVKHLIILGHSQCGGIQASLQSKDEDFSDFVSDWVSVLKVTDKTIPEDELAQLSLKQSKTNCMTFPWIRERVEQGELEIHLWFFDIKTASIFAYNAEKDEYQRL
jgi:carbonic anhydrase